MIGDMLSAVAGAGGWVLRTLPWLERPVFGCLRVSNARPFRSTRFRLFKAWGGGLTGERAVRLTRLAGGVQLAVDVRDWCGITYIEPGAIEPATTAYLLQHVRPDDVFVDAGANVGYMAMQVAERVGPRGAVWCFEPNPRLVGMIEQSIAANQFIGRVHPTQVALVDRDGPDRPFHLSADPANSGLSSLAPDEAHRVAGRMDELPPVNVPVTTFDTFARQREFARLDVIKIDVEGAELLVLEGMRQSITRFRPRFLIVETAIDSPARDLLAELGYRCSMLEPMDGVGRWGNVLFERADSAPVPA
jgi:FkbM family methyltransferase